MPFSGAARPNDGGTVGVVSDDDAARRSRLNGLKLRALVRDHLGVDDAPDPVEFAPGAALITADSAWVFLDDQPAKRLGAALLWAMRQGAGHLHVIAESGTGQLARRAGEFNSNFYKEYLGSEPAVVTMRFVGTFP